MLKNKWLDNTSTFFVVPLLEVEEPSSSTSALVVYKIRGEKKE